MARSFRRKSPSGAEAPATNAPDPDTESAPGTAADDAGDTGRPSKRRKKDADHGFGAWLKEIATIVVIALVLSFLIKTFLFRAFFIPSGSMEETLEIDDRIFVNQLVPQPFDLQRGDIVVFRDTEGWLPPQAAVQVSWLKEALIFIGLAPDESQQHLVKRVIGLPGDHVICCDAEGRLTVNGEPLDEPYLFPGANPSDLPFDVVVPEGKVWVMGDHRNASADSRANRDKPGEGFVAIENIEGKAAVIAWPLTRIGFLGNHPDVFGGVPDPEPAAQPTPAGP
ncbi:signal peptidase I [Arthrobacter sp. TmT3-37]|uniref:Signal peptidase I n=1 Tax=Arthrobacter agilis TaxID=37921 RepID=A0A2L0UDJ7_9MICC|nr:signal peptidase I [Arthrobacter agilis]AUZ87353.1 signal peptidase I [Arthrobacter agilis]